MRVRNNTHAVFAVTTLREYIVGVLKLLSLIGTRGKLLLHMKGSIIATLNLITKQNRTLWISNRYHQVHLAVPSKPKSLDELSLTVWGHSYGL